MIFKATEKKCTKFVQIVGAGSAKLWSAIVARGGANFGKLLMNPHQRTGELNLRNCQNQSKLKF